jgi:hypothetical protein
MITPQVALYTIIAVKGETRFLSPKGPSLGAKPWLLMGLKTWFLKKVQT